MKDNFTCLHKALKYCKRTLGTCNFECRCYGECGECNSYYIPAGQKPCKNCEHLKIGKVKGDER